MQLSASAFQVHFPLQLFFGKRKFVSSQCQFFSMWIMCFPLCLAQLLPSWVIRDRISPSTVSHNPLFDSSITSAPMNILELLLAMSLVIHMLLIAVTKSLFQLSLRQQQHWHTWSLCPPRHFLHCTSSFCFYLTVISSQCSLLISPLIPDCLMLGRTKSLLWLSFLLYLQSHFWCCHLSTSLKQQL